MPEQTSPLEEESSPPIHLPQELEPPVETQVALRVPASIETKPSGATETRARSLIKMGYLSAHAKEAILDEFRFGVGNPYNKIYGKDIG
jgi:hypothetical protein